MNLLTQPLFWLGALIFLVVAFIIGKKYAKKKIGDNPYDNDPKIKAVLDNPKLFKEKLSNVNITNSKGEEVRINKFIDNGQEVKY